MPLSVAEKLFATAGWRIVAVATSLCMRHTWSGNDVKSDVPTTRRAWRFTLGRIPRQRDRRGQLEDKRRFCGERNLLLAS